MQVLLQKYSEAGGRVKYIPVQIVCLCVDILRTTASPKYDIYSFFKCFALLSLHKVLTIVYMGE